MLGAKLEFESIRPVLSGIVGGIIATWLTSRWSRNLPKRYNRKSRESLIRQHRPAIWTANTLFFLSLCFGISLYSLGDFASTDWWPFLFGCGLASVLPLTAIGLISLATGRNPKEAYVAFSYGQGSPLWVTYGILGAGVVAFAFSLANFGT